MKNFKIIVINLCLIIFLYSCGSMSEAGKALRNEKTRSTDEFLVKKRDPLFLPPEYNKIPKPGTEEKKSETNSSSIEKILKIKDQDPSEKKFSSIEKSILNQISK